MSTWMVATSAALLLAGTTLLLSEVRWFARRPLVERLRPHLPGGIATRERAGILSVESFREVIGPVCRSVGERVSRLLGVPEGLELRLERIHASVDVTAFRVRQFGWSAAAFGVGAMGALALGLPLPFPLLLPPALALLAYLVIEQQLANASQRWRRRVFLELPVIAEQLAMLLNAGYSLTGALSRIAQRGHGACAEDLRRVLARVRQGLSDVAALQEWAALVDVPALHRLVPVLGLNREASDLGRLITEEAKSIRRDVQRELIETVEKRGEQVWIPVTVATLVPGVIFLSVPFVDALQLFAR
jgi:Flp pilus assembly protein TadB